MSSFLRFIVDSICERVIASCIINKLKLQMIEYSHTVRFNLGISGGEMASLAQRNPTFACVKLGSQPVQKQSRFLSRFFRKSKYKILGHEKRLQDNDRLVIRAIVSFTCN